MPDQIGYYASLKNAAGKVFAYLASITLTGTDGKTLTVSGDATISETPPLNANVIKGDGTAGRVIRVTNFNILNGTNANTLKLSTSSRWSGDVNGEVDNVAKGATTGVWDLTAGGTILTLLNAGISGDAVAVLSVDFYTNQSSTDVLFSVNKISTGLEIYATASTGGAVQDLTALVDSGGLYLNVTYVTSQ